MPYYVFAVRPLAQLALLAQFDSFQAASAEARALRARPSTDQGTRIKLMFADTALAAEDLLLQVREAGPSGDD